MAFDGRAASRYLDQDRVEGEDPTTLFGEHTIMSLKREDAMTHAPDLLLLSQYDPELGEVAAFEELIGSHGGLGGPQTKPFILHPTEWTLDEEVPLGAPAVYRNIRRWLSSIGIELGRPAGTAETTTVVPSRRRGRAPGLGEPEPRSRVAGDYGSAMNQTSLTPWPVVSPAALSAAKEYKRLAVVRDLGRAVVSRERGERARDAVAGGEAWPAVDEKRWPRGRAVARRTRSCSPSPS